MGGGSAGKWADPIGHAIANYETTSKVMKVSDPLMYSIQKSKENSVPKPAVEVKPPEPIVTTTASTTGGGAINQQQPSTYTGQFSSGVPYGMQQQQNQSPFSQRIAASNAANQQITGQNQFSMPNTNGLTFGGGY